MADMYSTHNTFSPTKMAVAELCPCHVYCRWYTYSTTSHVLLQHRNGERASERGIANLKVTIGSLLACSVDRLSFLVGCLNLGDLLVYMHKLGFS